MATIKKIIFFLKSPLSSFDVERFGFMDFIENGFEVEAWDITPFIDYDRFANYSKSHKADFETRYTFHSKGDILSAISQLTRDCLVINHLAYDYSTIFIYRAIARRGVSLCRVYYNDPTVINHPDYRVLYKKSLFDKLKDRLSNITMKDFTKFLFARIPVKLFKYFGIPPIDYLILGGGELQCPKLYTDERTIIIHSHHLDYDLYLRSLKNPAEVDNNMAVFLDQYEGFHPDDYAYTAGYPKISPEEYYPLVCGFFDYLQQNYSIHTVIAAHPRSDYTNHPDRFRGRPIVFGKTAELVRQSGLVILHDSTAMNLGIIHKKPMLFVTTDSSEKNRIWLNGYSTIDYRASLVHKRPINLNNSFEVDITNELAVDEDAYERYMNAYIKLKDSPDILTCQNLINHLRA